MITHVHHMITSSCHVITVVLGQSQLRPWL